MSVQSTIFVQIAAHKLHTFWPKVAKIVQKYTKIKVAE